MHVRRQLDAMCYIVEQGRVQDPLVSTIQGKAQV